MNIKILFPIACIFYYGCVSDPVILYEKAIIIDNAIILEEDGLTKISFDFINKTNKNIFFLPRGIISKFVFKDWIFILDNNRDLEDKPFAKVEKVPSIKIIAPYSKYNYKLQYEEYDINARQYRAEDVKELKVIFYMFLSEYKYVSYDEYLIVLKNHGIKVEKSVMVKKFQCR